MDITLKEFIWFAGIVHYDRTVKRQNRLGNFVFPVAVLYLAAVFAAASIFEK